jgi:murein DD-endopeptidase MepM/ murein hydrolase activator NlpD
MKKYINILIIPEGQEPSHNYRVSVNKLKIIGGAISLWILILVAGTIFLGGTIRKARLADTLIEENQHLKEYNGRVIEIEKNFNKNRELTAKIAAMAGVDIETLSPTLMTQIDTSAPTNSGRESISGIAGDNPPLTKEQLEKMRVPQGRPLYGWITRNYNADESYSKEKHDGVDIAVKEGTPVMATATGEIAFAGWDKDYGNMVIIDHGNGYKTVYGHNQTLLVGLGDKVYKGKEIATSGNSGHSSAPHLHYGIIKDGEPIDPSPFIN